MSDYLALARDHAQAAGGAVFDAPTTRAHLSAVTAFASLAIAEALTIPKGTVDEPGETTGTVAPALSPSEPSPDWPFPVGEVWFDPAQDDGEPAGEIPPSLVTLDHTEQRVARILAGAPQGGLDRQTWLEACARGVMRHVCSELTEPWGDVVRARQSAHDAIAILALARTVRGAL